MAERKSVNAKQATGAMEPRNAPRLILVRNVAPTPTVSTDMVVAKTANVNMGLKAIRSRAVLRLTLAKSALPILNVSAVVTATRDVSAKMDMLEMEPASANLTLVESVVKTLTVSTYMEENNVSAKKGSKVNPRKDVPKLTHVKNVLPIQSAPAVVTVTRSASVKMATLAMVTFTAQPTPASIATLTPTVDHRMEIMMVVAAMVVMETTVVDTTVVEMVVMDTMVVGIMVVDMEINLSTRQSQPILQAATVVMVASLSTRQSQFMVASLSIRQSQLTLPVQHIIEDADKWWIMTIWI